MIDTREEMKRKWYDARSAGRSGHEWRAVALSSNAPVRLLAALRESDDRVSLLIEATSAAAPIKTPRFEAQGLSLIEQRNSPEGGYRLCVTLERDELREVFEALCADIVGVANNSTQQADAIQSIIRRLNAWQACLRVRRSGLSREEQTGLLGELAVLKKIADIAGYQRTVASWQGPFDALHDFIGSGAAIEVKTSLGAGPNIFISRIEQLEAHGVSSLLLARPRFHVSANGKNLPQIVHAMRSEIRSSSPADLSDFDERLIRVGYMALDERLYEAELYVQESIEFFAVVEGFPMITSNILHNAIAAVTYVIDGRKIAEFKRDDEYFFKLVGANFGISQ